ncbi:MAG: hypothetical protein N4A43_04595 [Alphaproteobacteria bacterium]|jgi:hypothetical protein|nr:hypothetical protein [Alphaproteobacteria bacterium]
MENKTSYEINFKAIKRDLTKEISTYLSKAQIKNNANLNKLYYQKQLINDFSIDFLLSATNCKIKADSFSETYLKKLLINTPEVKSLKDGNNSEEDKRKVLKLIDKSVSNSFSYNKALSPERIAYELTANILINECRDTALEPEIIKRQESARKSYKKAKIELQENNTEANRAGIGKEAIHLRNTISFKSIFEEQYSI